MTSTDLEIEVHEPDPHTLEPLVLSGLGELPGHDVAAYVASMAASGRQYAAVASPADELGDAPLPTDSVEADLVCRALGAWLLRQAGEDVRAALMRVRTEGQHLRLVVPEPGDQTWEGLPWEYLRFPDDGDADGTGGFVVLDERVSIVRRVDGLQEPRGTPLGERPKLRVLPIAVQPIPSGKYDFEAVPLEHDLRVGVLSALPPQALVHPLVRPDAFDGSRLNFTDIASHLRLLKGHGAAPTVIHFVAHGTKDGGQLLLSNEDGSVLPTDAEDLGRALEASRPALLVLASCEGGAVGRRLGGRSNIIRAIVRHVPAPWVIASRTSLTSESARVFFSTLYAQLKSGETVESAHLAGCRALRETGDWSFGTMATYVVGSASELRFKVPSRARFGELRTARLPGASPEQHLRRQRRARGRAFVLVVGFALVGLVLAGFARELVFVNRLTALQERIRAYEAARDVPGQRALVRAALWADQRLWMSPPSPSLALRDELQSLAGPGKSVVVLPMGSNVTGLALSENGELLAGGTDEGDVRVWRLADGGVVAALHHDSPIESLTFRDAPYEVVAVGNDGSMTRWALPGGEAVAALDPMPDWKERLDPLMGFVFDDEGEFVVHRGELASRPAIARDGSWFVTTGGEYRDQLQVWTAQPISRRHLLAELEPCVPNGGGWECTNFFGRVAIAPDDRHLAVGDAWGVVRVFDATTGQAVAEWSAHPGHQISEVEFAADNNVLWTFAYNDDEHGIRAWKLPNGGLINEFGLGVRPSRTRAMRTLGDGNMGLFVLDGGTKHVVDLTAGETFLSLEAAGERDEPLVVSRSGDRVFAGVGSSVHVWALNGLPSRLYGIAPPVAGTGWPWVDTVRGANHLAGTSPMAFSADGEWIAGLFRLFETVVWDVPSRKVLLRGRDPVLGQADGVVGGFGALRGVSAYQLDRVTATFRKSTPDAVQVWDLAGGVAKESADVLEQGPPLEFASPYDVALLPGDRVVRRTAEPDVRIHDLATGALLHRFPIERYPVEADQERFVVEGGWGRFIASVDGSTLAIGSGAQFALGQFDEAPGSVAIWDTDSGAQVAQIEVPPGGAADWALSADGSWLAMLAADGWLRVWSRAERRVTIEVDVFGPWSGRRGAEPLWFFEEYDALVFDPGDGGAILVSLADGSTSPLFDVSFGRQQVVAASSGQGLFATISTNERWAPCEATRIWQLPSPQPFRTIPRCLSSRDLLFSPDGSSIATSWGPAGVAVWPLEHLPPGELLSKTGASSNLRVCRDSLDVVPVVPFPEPGSIWAPRDACP